MSRLFPVVLLISLMIAGCSQIESITTTVIAPTLSAQAPANLNIPPATTEADATAVVRPDWHNITLIDARTGASFTFADFSGRTVWVEPMATWCTNCRAQMRQVIEAQRTLNDDNFVFISLSVAENVSNEALAAYADREGFDWAFALTPPELLQALTEQFGRAVITPPSTPHFIISPNGITSPLSTGSHNAAEIVNIMQRANIVS